MQLAPPEDLPVGMDVSLGEFQHLLLGLITVSSQIRNNLDLGGDEFKAIVASICQEGVIEPVIVNRQVSD